MDLTAEMEKNTPLQTRQHNLDVQFPEDFLRQGFQKTKQNGFKSFGWFKLQPHGWRTFSKPSEVDDGGDTDDDDD